MEESGKVIRVQKGTSYVMGGNKNKKVKSKKTGVRRKDNKSRRKSKF